MIKEKVKVTLRSGLQARAASMFVQEANRFRSTVFLEKNNKKVNAKSIMGLMSLAVGPNSEIVIEVNGPDEEKAMTHLKDFITN